MKRFCETLTFLWRFGVGMVAGYMVAKFPPASVVTWVIGGALFLAGASLRFAWDGP